MDDRDFMALMYQGMVKTTHADDSYWGFEEDDTSPFPRFDLFYVTADDPETKNYLGYVGSEADAAFITAVHGAFPDIYRRWLQALDEADEKDAKADDAENVAGSLARALKECQQAYARAEVSEDWHGIATSQA